MSIQQTHEIRALVAILEAEKGLAHLSAEVSRPLFVTLGMAKRRLESIFRDQGGYYIGDQVMHGTRGPFLVEGLVSDPAGVKVLLRKMKKDGTPSEKQTWEWLLANLTPVAP
ncbi:hypothetical protein WL29_23150 [Burkholderia ubonensis]|uniref:Uncharacterized protein n=1 Tax=Burkholderia ubonensis TaxID=101571 RepID=A0A106QD53_9BURK|nr:hypothetical protein [Burkholderia ubonensis]KWA84260.1 hypothetical protein WL29_23150 [Burkholderia ubonensis]